MPLTRPISRPTARATAIAFGRAVRAEARDRERRRRRSRRDREVDAAGEHDERLAGGDQAEHRRVEERRRELLRRQEGVPGLDAVDDVRRDEEADEDEREHDRRVVAEQASDVDVRVDGHGRRRHVPDFPFCRSASPPIMITRTISVPWITCAQFWSTPLMISSVFTSVRTNAAAIGPTGRRRRRAANAAEDDRGDGVQGVDVARVRVAEPDAAVRARPPSAANVAASA